MARTLQDDASCATLITFTLFLVTTSWQIGQAESPSITACAQLRPAEKYCHGCCEMSACICLSLKMR